MKFRTFQQNVGFICYNKASLKMMKYVFYFMLKALFVLEAFKFLFWFLWSGKKTTWLENLS